MKIRYKIGADCFAAAHAASGEKLNREDIEAAFQRMAEYKANLQASGDIANLGDKLKSFAEREAERTKIAAAMQKRHAALNILVRDRLDQAVTGFIDAGMAPKKALLAVLEGTQKGVEGGRNSVAALSMAYEKRYLGGMLGEMQADRPHLIAMLGDKQFDGDILREMAELKEGGKPGITGNADAVYTANMFAKYAELSRTDLNRLGASIGKLDGWAGAQSHDDMKMIEAGKTTWVDRIIPKLDLAKTFPDISSLDELKGVLGDIYDTIITGMPSKPTAAELGQRVSPANLAKSLGKSRVLHFSDAEAALAYRDEFGYGTTFSGMVSHLRQAGRMAGNMESLGPNPEVMFTSLVDGLARKISEDPNLAPAEKAKQTKSLKLDGGALRHALDISTGMISRPVNSMGAKIGGDIRAVESMAKLGGALFSSVMDPVTNALASQFRGSGFFKGFLEHLDGIKTGRPKGEVAEISYLLGEGFDGLIGHVLSPHAAIDGPVGVMSKLQEKFFRWNGLTWWTDIGRAVAGRMVSSEMGMRAKTAFNDLPANYKHVLGLHGITEPKWEAIRQAEFREVNGKSYVTPDRIRDLPDEAILPLVADRQKLADVSLETRKIASRMVDEREAEWVAKRKAKLDEWQTEADSRLASVLGGNEIRSDIEKQLAGRRLDLEKERIKSAKVESDLLDAVRGQADNETLNSLFDTSGSGLAARTDNLVERITNRAAKSGETLGSRRQRLNDQIKTTEARIAEIEAKRSGRLGEAEQKLDSEYNRRIGSLRAFAGKLDAKASRLADAPEAERLSIASDIQESLSGRENEFIDWLADAATDLEARKGGDEVRSGIETELAARRASLLRDKIEQIENESDLVGAAASMRDQQRIRAVISKVGNATDALLDRSVSRARRTGESLGARRQRAQGRIKQIERDIAAIEKRATQKDADAIARVNDAFKSREAELKDFTDKAYTREQQRADILAKDIAAHPRRLQDIVDQGRRDLEMSVLRFVADETNYGVIVTDARSRRTTTLGTRPGTIAGEGIRFIMQFKGFPIAFGQRVLGRAAFGFRKGAKLEQTAHIGTLLAGLTMAGYAAMTMKDMARGYWPPRDPTDPKTWAAAFVQGGAMGIYGDYLFSQVNRFGSGPLETAVGPAAGTASDFVKLVLKARDAGLSPDEKVKAADWLNFATQNTPLVNLFYTKPVLDYLFLNSMKEAVSPGYTAKTQGRRMKEYGQHSVFPPPLKPFN